MQQVLREAFLIQTIANYFFKLRSHSHFLYPVLNISPSFSALLTFIDFILLFFLTIMQIQLLLFLLIKFSLVVFSLTHFILINPLYLKYFQDVL